MSEQAEVEQHEVVREQGDSSSKQEALAGVQASAGSVPANGAEENEVGESAMDAQSSASGLEEAAGDQEIAPLKDLHGHSMEGSAANPLSGMSTGSVSNNLSGSALNMDSLMDVPVTVSVEIGRKRMPINQLVDLAPGAIVDLNRDLDAPIDLLVNGTLIARGEVVVMGKKFGLRLVDICSPNERLRGLSQ